jgi:hypothetical protein
LAWGEVFVEEEVAGSDAEDGDQVEVGAGVGGGDVAESGEVEPEREGVVVMPEAMAEVQPRPLMWLGAWTCPVTAAAARRVRAKARAAACWARTVVRAVSSVRILRTVTV